MRSFFLTCVFLLPLITIAQVPGTVSGRLVVHGAILSDTHIKLIKDPSGELAAEAVTDTNGYFKFTRISDGTFTLVYVGSDGKDVVAYTDLRNSSRIDPTSTINETVTISSTTSQTLNEVSKTVNVIDGSEMRDRADFSLIDTLRSIPGFRVQQLGGFGRTANIKTRGLRNQDTAILIDGIRFRDPSAITGDASPFLSDITLTSVNRIEVLRGSGSSLYGTNAIGGTIDFQTPEPRPGFHGQIGGAVGGLGLGRFRGNVSDGTRDGKFGFTIGVSRTVYTKGIDGQDDAHNTNFQSRIEYKPFQKTSISARFFVSDAFVRLNSDPDTAGALPTSNSVIIRAAPNTTFVPDVNDPDSFQRSQFFDGQLVLTQVFSNKLVGQAFYSGVRTSRKNDNGPLGIGFQSPSTSVFKGLINTVNGHLNWVPNSTNSITAGYEFEAEKFGNDGFTPTGLENFSTRAKQSSSTIYVQDLIGLFEDRLQLAGSARAQFFDLKNPEFSSINAPYSGLRLQRPPSAYTFDGAVAYTFRDFGTKLRAHVGNGYRVPSLFERFGTFYNTFAFPSPRFEALGDPFLKPERSIAGDAGIEQDIWKDKGRLTAVYFYTKLLNTIGFGNVVPNIGLTPRFFGGYLNTQGGIARGIELSGKLRPFSTTDLFASYTFTNSDQRVPQITGSGNIETLGIPAHQFTFVATQRYRQFWINVDFLASSSYLGTIFDTNAFTFQSYIYRFKGNRRADLTAGYTIPIKKDFVNLRIFGTIENLLDYNYYENGFRTHGRNGRIGLSFGF